MAPVLVLVTGSRALAGHDDARVWLREQLAALDPSVVVTGDAAGPDAEAMRWAESRPVAEVSDAVALAAPGSARPFLMVYTLTGAIRSAWLDRRMIGAWWTREMAPARHLPEAKRWPLVRNAAMVRDVVALSDRYAVTVLALRADWAPTQGTAHTVGLARRAGLMVVEQVFTRGAR